MEITEGKFQGAPSVLLSNMEYDGDAQITVESGSFSFNGEPSVFIHFTQKAGFYTLDEIDTLIATLMVVRQGVAENST